MPIPLSVLDLSPVGDGQSAGDALEASCALAAHAATLGFSRYWFAEHHNAGGLACPVPEIMAATVAARTAGIRVGTGGVMLPNHSPLRIAETFRVLSALHPDRIDLGLGRAPGTDKKTAIALRRHPSLLEDTFPALLDELCGHLLHEPDRTRAFNPTKAVPLGVAPPAMWLLGASVASAREAGTRGLAYAYAHHFNPREVDDALAAYRASFTPSAFASAPRTLVAMAVTCGEDDAHATYLARSGALFWLYFGRGTRDLPLPSAERAAAHVLDDEEQALVAQAEGARVVGDRDRVRAAIDAVVARSGADEVMITSSIHEPAERRANLTRIADAIRA